MSDWKPIATAPKNGTAILAWQKHSNVLMVRWICCYDFMTETEMKDWTDEECSQEDWFYADFVCGGRLDKDDAPTHWMPLPEPPWPQSS